MRRKLSIALVYSSLFLVIFESCVYNDINVPFDCDTSDLAIVAEGVGAVSGCKSIDGFIIVAGSGGAAPYNFNINGGEYQTNNHFTDLGSGVYAVRVKDANNCWRSIDIEVPAASGASLKATASTTPDNQCSADNGSINVSVTGGKAPYQYQIDAKGFVTASSFSNVKSGQHSILVKDADECQTNLSVDVPHGATGTSFANNVKSILTNSCNLSGCHGAGTGTRDWTVFNNVKNNAANIKTRTGNRSMPPGAPLTQAQIDLIGCWVDDGALDN